MKRLICLSLLYFLITVAFAQRKYGTGCLYDSVRYDQVMLTAPLTRGDYNMPPRASLKAFAPQPGDQGITGMCTAWSAAYASRTILMAQRKLLKDKTQINANAFSPSFVYNQIRLTGDCSYGAYISDALSLMKTQGSTLLSDFPIQCEREITNLDRLKAKSHLIQDYKRLFLRSSTGAVPVVLPLKKALSEGKPIVASIKCWGSMENAKGAWNPPAQGDINKGYHAITVVGYDDELYGGAFEIMNSWGTNWGNEGFIWVRYTDFEKNCMEAYELSDGMPEPTPKQPAFSGEIIFKKDNGEVMAAAWQKGNYVMKQAYYSGTSFQFFISHEQPIYLYVVGTDNSGKFSLLFPYNNNVSPLMSYKRSTIAFPSENHFVQLDNNMGSDYICIFYSRAPLNINDLITRLEITNGNLTDKIKNSLGRQMVSNANVQYKADRISFSVKNSQIENGNIVPIVVEIKHQ